MIFDDAFSRAALAATAEIVEKYTVKNKVLNRTITGEMFVANCYSCQISWAPSNPARMSARWYFHSSASRQNSFLCTPLIVCLQVHRFLLW